MTVKSLALCLALGAATWAGSAAAEDATPKPAPAAEGSAMTHKAAPAADCVEIASKVVPMSVCLAADDWAYADINDDAEHAIRNLKREVYLMMLTENQAFTMDQMKQAIMINIQSAAKLNKVETVEDTQTEIDGHPFGDIVYRAKIGDVEVTYENYYTSFPGTGSGQVVMFASTAEFDELRPIMKDVYATLHVTDAPQSE